MDRKEAEKILRHMGKIFGVSRIAEEAIDELPFWLKRGDDPVIVGWEVFLSLLEDYEMLERAFEKGINVNLVGWGLKALRLQDAEDVAQIARYQLWCSFLDFRPYEARSWYYWMRKVMNDKKNSFLEKLYRERDNIEWTEGLWFDWVDWTEFRSMEEKMDREEAWEEEREIGSEHIAVEIVAERWISGGHPSKALFAAKILSILNNEEDYVGLMGSYMEDYVGVSRQCLSNWTKEFIREVYNEGKG